MYYLPRRKWPFEYIRRDHPEYEDKLLYSLLQSDKCVFSVRTCTCGELGLLAAVLSSYASCLEHVQQLD